MLRLLALFIPKWKEFLNERNSKNKVSSNQKKYWIHCASLGEYEMAFPIIEELLKKNNLSDLLITFFSPSGYKQAIKGEYAESILYLPFDTRKNVNAFYNDYQPQTAIFIRYDLWFNYLHIGLDKGVKFFLVNGRFTKTHFIFKFIGKSYKKLVQRFEVLFLSDKQSEFILREHNFTNFEWTGDTRYDRVSAIAQRASAIVEIAEFKNDRKLLVVGSSWAPEENAVLKLLEKQNSDIAVVIAPHDIKRSAEIIAQFKKFGAIPFSTYTKNTDAKVLVIDNIGMLSRIYQYADFCLIGGGFTGKLHNILEPAVWGNPVLFGPHITKFPEATDFINKGFGFCLDDDQRWIDHFLSLAKDGKLIRETQQKAKEFVRLQVGATRKICDKIMWRH